MALETRTRNKILKNFWQNIHKFKPDTRYKLQCNFNINCEAENHIFILAFFGARHEAEKIKISRKKPLFDLIKNIFCVIFLSLCAFILNSPIFHTAHRTYAGIQNKWCWVIGLTRTLYAVHFFLFFESIISLQSHLSCVNG